VAEQKISPCLWFDNRAEEAVASYTSTLKNSRIGRIERYGESGAEVSGREKGSVMTVEFELCGQKFVALNGGPHFQFSPAVSLSVRCETAEEAESVWSKLLPGGKVMMEFGEYPFSKRYGFLQDKFGLAWQVILCGTPQKIEPSFLFVQKRYGKALEAMNFYVSLLGGSKINDKVLYGANDPNGDEGAVMYASFDLAGQTFSVMDGKGPHEFDFTGAISFQIFCDDQAEVDRLWDAIPRGGGEASQCGWVMDKFGVYWQVVPKAFTKHMKELDPARTENVLKALYKMKKIIIKELEAAARN
jgi:predicted 3-demethylubiquinone-9 3-methyltransferase (glyoxalase superfamily)